MECARVKKDILDHRLCVDPNALSVQTVFNIKLALIKNAEIHVQEHAALMPDAKL